MSFYRNLNEELNKWSQGNHRLPLIIKGARQVGKTHLIREFSKNFPNFHEFNFQKSNILCEGFSRTNDPKKLIEYLEVVSEKKINLSSDLIFFDEIQDCPQALNSLKYFAEEFPKIYLIAAGSLLGIYLSSHSFPVGKVSFLNLFPLSFFEFLKAIGKEKLSEKSSLQPEDNNLYHEELSQELNKYMILGGLPQVVKTFIESKDFVQAREIQVNLLTSYKADFSKYSGPVDALKILTVFENIPKQLAKENRKFQFNFLKKGSRYNEFAGAIDWLTRAGLSYKIPIIHHAEIPLKAQTIENNFKLYFFDIGLLGALADLPLSVYFQKSDLFKTFKGASTENFFLQEFRAHRKEDLYCWQGKTSEVDFLYTTQDMQLMPIEVKSGESGKLKSLSFFQQKYNCKWKSRVSAHPLEIREDTQLKSLPLYLSSLA